MKALNYTLKVIFIVFDIESLITTSVFSNRLDLSNSHSEDNKDEDKRFSFFKKLLLNVEEAQESQQSDLKLGENKVANTDSSSSIHSKNNSSTSEQGERHCSLSTS